MPTATGNRGSHGSTVELPNRVLSRGSGVATPAELVGVGVSEVDGVARNAEMPGEPHFASRPHRYFGELSPISETPPEANYHTKPSSTL